jgi:dTDP-4-dehydrorhamnose reductase
MKVGNPDFKVVLIGASGLLGRAVSDELTQQTRWRVVRTAFRHGDAESVKLDIRNEEAVRRFIAEQKPDAIVVAAAERRPDICENDPSLAKALNVDALGFIGSIANEIGAWVLSISTDYVFDGTRPPYQPEDAPNPLNAYGRSKLEGERALTRSTARSCVLRLPLLYGPVTDWSESAVTSLAPAIAKSAVDGIPAVMDAWATRYPTFTPDVAIVIRQLLEQCECGTPVNGVVHWSGDEAMTKFDIAICIARVLQLSAKIHCLETPVDATPRPKDCHLASDALNSMNIGQRTAFDAGIHAVFLNWPEPTITRQTV